MGYVMVLVGSRVWQRLGFCEWQHNFFFLGLALVVLRVWRRRGFSEELRVLDRSSMNSTERGLAAFELGHLSDRLVLIRPCIEL